MAQNEYWNLNECRWVHYTGAPAADAVPVPAQRADEPAPDVVPAP